ncbi:MAG: ribonuclease P protein subunit [Sulfolobales archaeon]
MRRRRGNLIYHEILGLPVRIVSSLDPGVEGLEGVVVNETMKTITIRSSSGREVTTFKIGTRYRFRIPETGEEVEIDGDMLFGRPEDRVRRIVKR